VIDPIDLENQVQVGQHKALAGNISVCSAATCTAVMSESGVNISNFGAVDRQSNCLALFDYQGSNLLMCDGASKLEGLNLRAVD